MLGCFGDEDVTRDSIEGKGVQDLLGKKSCPHSAISRRSRLKQISPLNEKTLSKKDKMHWLFNLGLKRLSGAGSWFFHAGKWIKGENEKVLDMQCFGVMRGWSLLPFGFSFLPTWTQARKCHFCRSCFVWDISALGSGFLGKRFPIQLRRTGWSNVWNQHWLNIYRI